MTQEFEAKMRQFVLAALTSAQPQDVMGLVDTLAALDPTEQEKAEARGAVFAAMAYAQPREVKGLVDTLRALDGRIEDPPARISTTSPAGDIVYLGDVYNVGQAGAVGRNARGTLVNLDGDGEVGTTPPSP